MASARKQREDERGAQVAATIPAPQKAAGDVPHVDVLQREQVPSSRPTSVPAHDVGEIAAASFHGATKQRLPIDLTVPVRRRASADGAPLRAAFLLSHVDGRMSIAELAACAQIPLDEAVDAFRLLADLGLVELRGVAGATAAAPRAGDKPAPPLHQSGLRPKTR